MGERVGHRIEVGFEIELAHRGDCHRGTLRTTRVAEVGAEASEVLIVASDEEVLGDGHVLEQFEGLEGSAET